MHIGSILDGDHIQKMNSFENLNLNVYAGKTNFPAFTTNIVNKTIRLLDMKMYTLVMFSMVITLKKTTNIEIQNFEFYDGFFFFRFLYYNNYFT